MAGTAVAKKEAKPASLIPEDLITKIGDEARVADLTKSANYIPSVRVFDGSSKPCKSGKLPPGEIAIYKDADSYIQLGREINALVIGYRPRAAIMDGGNVQNFFDDASEEFKLVEGKAKAGVKNYNAGLEYLLYLPDTKGFAVFFLGNKSGRRESPKLKELVGRATTIKSQFVEKPANSWWCADIHPCSTPFDLPDVKLIKEAVQLFTDSAKDTATSSEEDTGGRKV